MDWGVVVGLVSAAVVLTGGAGAWAWKARGAIADSHAGPLKAIADNKAELQRTITDEANSIRAGQKQDYNDLCALVGAGAAPNPAAPKRRREPARPAS